VFSRDFLLWCRRFILQYVVVKPVLSIISLVLEMFDLYGDGVLRFNRGYLYVAIVYNISISVRILKYYIVLWILLLIIGLVIVILSCFILYCY